MPFRRRVAGLLLPLLVLAGCSGGEDTSPADAVDAAAEAEPTAVAAAKTGSTTVAGTEDPAGSCGAWDGELVAAGTAAGEPTLEVPVPAGWERDTRMDSELVRLALINPGLTAGDFAPNVVVTAEPAPADAEAAIEVQLAGISEFTRRDDLEIDRGETCGHPSATVDYQLPAMGAVPARPATVKIVVVPRGPESVTYTITAQATESVDPTYERDVAAMLEGLRITG